jgi:hypothetical protein
VPRRWPQQARQGDDPKPGAARGADRDELADSATRAAMASIAASSSMSRSAQTTRASRSAAYARVAGRPSGVGQV